MTSFKPLGRVMLIDDEQFDQKMYRRILDRSQAAEDVVSFTYAEDALAYLCDPISPDVDLILLDVNMPRMNGFEFLRALEDETDGDVDAVIILMLTVSLTKTDSLRAANSPLIQECFSKPFRPDYIEAAADLISLRRGFGTPPPAGTIIGGGGGSPASRMLPSAYRAT